VILTEPLRFFVMLLNMSAAPSPVAGPGLHLLGRERETAALDRLLDAARRGEGDALVIHGEPGVGKTALLQYAIQAGDGFQVARTSGVEREMELPFAAAQQLCSTVTPFVDRLPQPQGDALRVAFGLAAGQPPNPFLVGLAILGLLSEAAAHQPLVAVVDDAQWLDHASARALAFVARRLLAERVALVFATRVVGDPLRRLRELHVAPLGRRHARALLESRLTAPLDDHVRERILQETRGNPLALIELPRGLTPAQLAGGFGLPASAPLSAGIEETFMRRLASLPHDARRLLLVAAADSVGDPALLWRAADLLGIAETAGDAVQSEGLLSFGPRTIFRHPLVRSAVYRGSEPKERREVHRALADATDPEADPDRRAWHQAHAAAAPDEDVASNLEDSASRAQARGGVAAAAAFLERASALTPEPSRRAERALLAAQAMFEGGSLDDALVLLDTAESGSVVADEIRARAHLLRAQIAFASSRGSDATPLLLAAARGLEQVLPRLARATYLEAMSAAMFAGRLTHSAGMVEVSEAALAGPPIPDAPAPSDLLLHGLAVRFTVGHEAGAPILKEALRAFQRESALPPSESRWLWFASWIALFMWDDAAWAALSARQLELVRETGALSALPFVLTNSSSVYAFLGELDTAMALETELTAATEATGIAPVPYGALSIAALRGREVEFSELMRTVVSEAEARGEGLALTVSEFLSGALYNGLCRYDRALAATLPAEEFSTEGPAIWALTELIEAAVRHGELDRARAALDRVQESTRAAGTDWALGIAARSRALLSDGAEAETLYREAIERLGRTTIRVQLARTHLLFGEWLRRAGRRLEAREELRRAHGLLSTFGVEAFADRARVELAATGEHARRRSADALDQLTPQEAQISRLVAEGLANREIAVRLFISPSTVEYHLRKAFRKLNVKSRTQLAHRLSSISST
jgi:DNA-binding CsgD family transcriptional regulator